MNIPAHACERVPVHAVAPVPLAHRRRLLPLPARTCYFNRGSFVGGRTLDACRLWMMRAVPKKRLLVQHRLWGVARVDLYSRAALTSGQFSPSIGALAVHGAACANHYNVPRLAKLALDMLSGNAQTQGGQVDTCDM